MSINDIICDQKVVPLANVLINCYHSSSISEELEKVMSHQKLTGLGPYHERNFDEAFRLNGIMYSLDFVNRTLGYVGIDREGYNAMINGLRKFVPSVDQHANFEALENLTTTIGRTRQPLTQSRKVNDKTIYFLSRFYVFEDRDHNTARLK